MIGVVLVYALVCASGAGIARAILGARARTALVWSLAPGAGFAVLAALMFLSLAIFGQIFVWAIALLLLLIVFRTWFRRDTLATNVSLRNQVRSAWPALALTALAAGLWALRAARSPHGTGIDAWAIWKLKARFLYLSPDWRAIFDPAVGFSHADYPLFYPLSIVAGWIGAGRETLAAPLALSLLFTAAAALLLYAALYRDHGPDSTLKLQIMAAMLVLSTPHFIGIGASQYADILVVYFNLAAFALMDRAFDSRDRRLALAAGFFAGAGTFVKNEGLMFCAVFFGVSALHAWIRRHSNRKLVFWAVCGAIPLVAVTVIFKFLAQSPNQMFTGEATASYLAPGILWERARAIAGYLVHEIFQENKWVYGWFVCAAAMAMRRRVLSPGRESWRLLVIGGVFAGYFLVYLFTANDLQWHLASSADRVILHIYLLTAYSAFCRDAAS